jgi:hypothetical protein
MASSGFFAPLRIAIPCFFFFFLISNSFLITYFLKKNLHLLMCVYIIWTTLPQPCLQAELVLPSCSMIYWRKNIKDNENIVFLLVCDKDSYIGKFLVLPPCTGVLQPKLVHLYQTSSLFLSLLPIVSSASLRLLYSLFYGENINHFQVFGFLPFPFPSCVWSPLSVWPMSNITAFVLGL